MSERQDGDPRTKFETSEEIDSRLWTFVQREHVDAQSLEDALAQVRSSVSLLMPSLHRLEAVESFRTIEHPEGTTPVNVDLVERIRIRTKQRLAQAAMAELAEVVVKAQLGTQGERPEPPLPPQAGQWLLSLLAPAKSVDELLGDTEELYGRQVARFGHGRAGIWYWINLTKTAAHLVLKAVLAALPFAALLGWRSN